MSYLHIKNLYQEKRILEFKRIYAMEKIHGTSAHISFKEGKLSFFSGGASHEQFVSLFDQEALIDNFSFLGQETVVFGEAYGGKMQGMRATYGDILRFVAFEVKIGECWLDVPNAEEVAKGLGLDFVSYKIVDTELSSIDAALNEPSVQAVKNGMGDNHKREGIVLRPMFEVRLNNGERLLAKHKHEDFQETKSTRPLDAAKLEVLTKATEIADEWVTDMRLTHVLDKFDKPGIEKTGDIIKAMLEDVEREAVGEVVMSKEARAAIGKKTAKLFKDRLKGSLKND